MLNGLTLREAVGTLPLSHWSTSVAVKNAKRGPNSGSGTLSPLFSVSHGPTPGMSKNDNKQQQTTKTKCFAREKRFAASEGRQSRWHQSEIQLCSVCVHYIQLY